MRGFFTLLIMLCSLAGYSQKLMIGVQGGLLFNTAPMGSNHYFTSFESSPQMLLGGKLALDTRKIQLGVGCHVSSIEYTREKTIPVFGLQTTFDMYYSSAVINPYLYLNLKKNFVRSYLYIGASAGFTHFNSGKDEVYYGSYLLDGMSAEGTIPTAGLQAGASLKLIDGLRMSAEAGMRYTTTTPGFMLGESIDEGSYEGGLFSFPLTVGIDYAF